MKPLATIAELGVKLKLTISNTDPYAKMMLDQASNRVRFVARQPGWVARGEPVGSGQTTVPDNAHDITIWLAERAYTDTRNLQRRTSGPVSETYFENGVSGLELTDAETVVLEEMRPGRSSNGLWVQPVGAGTYKKRPIFLPDEAAGADGLMFSALDEGAFGPVI